MVAMERVNSHCFLCYKSAALKHEKTVNCSDSQFLLLLSRYLKIHSNSKKLRDEFLCCEDCSNLAKSFCDLIFQLEHLQLQLNWKLRKICDTMTCAGRVPSRVQAFRTQFEEVEDVDKNAAAKQIFEEIQEARKSIIRKGKLKLNSSQPRVSLQRLPDTSTKQTGREIKTEKCSPKKATSAHTQIECIRLPQTDDCRLMATLLTYVAVLHLSLPLHPTLVPKSSQEGDCRDIDNLMEIDTESLENPPCNIDEEVTSTRDDDDDFDNPDMSCENDSVQRISLNLHKGELHHEMDINLDTDLSELVIKRCSLELEPQTEFSDGHLDINSCSDSIDDCVEVLTDKNETLAMKVEQVQSQEGCSENQSIVNFESGIISAEAVSEVDFYEKVDDLNDFARVPGLEIVNDSELLIKFNQPSITIVQKEDPVCRTDSVENAVTNTLTQTTNEETLPRKSLRSLLKCCKCQKTFTSQVSLDLHIKQHEDEEVTLKNSDSDEEVNMAVENEIDEDFQEDVHDEDEHSEAESKESEKEPSSQESSDSEESIFSEDDGNQVKSESKPKLKKTYQPNGKPRGRPRLNKPKILKRNINSRNKELPHTECETCHETFSCEAALEKHRVQDHKLRDYVCCHSCGRMFNCHRMMIRHRLRVKRVTCFVKNPKDLEPHAAPLFPFSKDVYGNKFCPEDGCHEVFKYEEMLSVHLKSHGKWSCTFCPVEFGKAHEYAFHELRNHNFKASVSTSNEVSCNETISWATQIKLKKATDPYDCSRCKRTFEREQALISHFLHKHLDIPEIPEVGTHKNQCEICKKVLRPDLNEKLVKAHYAQHNVEGMDPSAIAICTICQAPFTKRVHLSNHLRLIHNKLAHKCPYCEKEFRKDANFRHHMNQVHKGKPSGLSGAFECDICKERLSNQFNLERHIKQHERNDKVIFKCELCPKTFLTRLYLNNHVKNVHQPPKQTWPCESCGKIFKNKQKLGQHTSYTHTDPSEWKFVCPEKDCGKRCWSRQKLTEHIRTHTKECLFVCDFCGEGYRYRQYLRAHLAKAHGPSAAKSLPTQRYTKPFHEAVTEKDPIANNEEVSENLI